LREFGAGRRLDPPKPGPVGTIHVNTVEKQHVKMDVSPEKGQEYRAVRIIGKDSRTSGDGMVQSMFIPCRPILFPIWIHCYQP
jgi:hypothetical protein